MSCLKRIIPLLLNRRSKRCLVIAGLVVGFVTAAVAQTITGFVPSFAATNELIRIDGSGFSDVRTVQFFNNKKVDVFPTADTQISVVVPAGASTGPVGLIKPGSAPIYSSQDFIVIGPEPFITDSPSGGGVGSVVTIYGVHFTGASSVKFNGTNASFSPPATDTQIQATVPANVTTGPISITTPRGIGVSTNLFYVPPVVTKFAPFSGRTGTNVIFTGKNFTGTFAVKFQNINASFTVNSPTQITAIVPSNAISGSLTVTAPGGSFITSSNFVVPPTIYGFSPPVGPIGSTVTISGANLNEGRVGAPVLVKFNGVAAVNPALSANQITAVVPAGATTGAISVTTTNGLAVTSSNFVVSAVSDLALNATAFPNPVFAGSNVTFSLTITNRGANAAQAVSVSNALPPTASLVSSSTTRGTITGNNALVTASVGDLPANAGAQITIVATMASPGTFTNTATARSLAFDPVPENNVAASVIGVLPTPRLAIRAVGPIAVEISWPSALTNLALQASESIGTAGGWTNSNLLPTRQGGNFVITNSVDGFARFYRLRSTN